MHVYALLRVQHLGNELALLDGPPPFLQALEGVPLEERCVCKPRTLAEAAQQAAAQRAAGTQ
jgi:hypothetical protein